MVHVDAALAQAGVGMHQCTDMPNLGLGLDSLLCVVLLVLCVVHSCDGPNGESQSDCCSVLQIESSLHDTDSLLPTRNTNGVDGSPAEVVPGQSDTQNPSTSGCRMQGFEVVYSFIDALKCVAVSWGTWAFTPTLFAHQSFLPCCTAFVIVQGH